MIAPTMATPNRRGPGRPRGRKKTLVIQARVDQALHDVLAALALENHRSKNAELVVALEAHAKAAGR